MLVASIVIFWPSQDDLSRYGYIYLMKHKSETFEKFKEFHSEVENHRDKKIKFLWSDRREEYLSYEFGLQLKQCEIVSLLTPPGTPRCNDVSEHRNRTLLDIVRSMMSLTDLPLSFWGYALETAAFTLKGHHLNPLRRRFMNCGLARNQSCRFLKFGIVMLIWKGFILINSKPNRRNMSS